METKQKAARLNAPVHDVRGSGDLGLPQQTPAQALFIENLRNRYVIKRITRSARQETAMASALL